jgi:uncharacterized protein YdeI (YjbR/CyaY-like superfamily)
VEIGKTLRVTRREQWRDWLAANHASEPEIWLIFHTKASGKPQVTYNDAVAEALCFGWIDSIVKKHGPDSRAQRFTPRRPKSKLSEMNKVRVRRLAAEGRMTPAGLAVIGDVLDEPFVVPEDILAALQADSETWRNFEAFPESYQRIRIGWIDGARQRPAIFQQRLDYFLRLTKQNKRFGMVQ